MRRRGPSVGRPGGPPMGHCGLSLGRLGVHDERVLEFSSTATGDCSSAVGPWTPCAWWSWSPQACGDDQVIEDETCDGGNTEDGDGGGAQCQEEGPQ